MATITFDGQSLVLDGRRVWLVSGGISYARTPRAEWADRIHAAKLAGLNTIETSVVWSRHEPRPNQYDFTGDNDLRHFIELIQQAGMYCILRVGPYIGQGFDNGGLPPWLAESATMRLRTNSQPFLEACSRYITALAQQVRTLQAVVGSSGRKKAEEVAPGPIILIQNEMGWFCGHETLAQSYLGELDRYYREAGFAVPVVNANDLWQSVEGEIDGWTGTNNLLAHLRQLVTIRPTQPRMVMDLRVGRTDVWGKPAAAPRTAGDVMRTLAEVLAAGGQYNISPFAGGTNFGFAAGGDPANAHYFYTTSNDGGAPVDELGRPSALYSAVRKVSTFASRFHRLLSHLDPRRQSVALLPTQFSSTTSEKPNHRRTSTPAAGTSAIEGGVSVVHTSGDQGGIVFLFNDRFQNDQQPQIHTLLLPDGSTLPVDLRGQPVAWVLLDARITGRSQIDYSNLSAFAIVGKVFVCYGPAGSRGVLSINGSPLETLVPAAGKPPFIHEHEGLHIVVANTESIDTVYLDDQHVYVGVAGIDRSGKPIALPEAKSCIAISADGQVTTHKFASNGTGPTAHKPAKVTLGEWQCARVDEHWLGTSARFASVAGPNDLAALGAPYGYGWYRLRFNSSAAHKVRVAFPEGSHRLHLALNGEQCGVVGVGPGAEAHGELPLKKKQQTLVVLAENLGRISAGTDLGERVGLFGEPWIVSPVKPGKPKVVASEPVDLLKFRAPLWRVHEDDTTDPARLTWSIQHRKKTPIFMRIGPLDANAAPGTAGQAGVVLLNDKPVKYFQSGGCAPIRFDAEQLSRGTNEVQIAMVGSTAAAADALAEAVHFEEGEEKLTDKGEWAFAKWEIPGADAFTKPHRAPAGVVGAPAWWRATFTVANADSAAPLFFDASGLSKGQVYVNGRHLGRFFTATASGKNVPPQHRLWIPKSFLRGDEANEIVFFDEHGFTPTKAKIVSSNHLASIGD